MKKKIIIFAIVLITLISGIVTYMILNKDSNNSQNEIIEENIDEKTVDILSDENTDVIGRLKIDSIELDAEIKDGTELSTLKTAIGHFKNTPYFSGNICFAAHNRGYNQNFFERLNEVKEGDKVEYITKYVTQTYYISQIKEINETDLSVLNATEEDQITMITCIKNQKEKRLCVIASKQ